MGMRYQFKLVFVIFSLILLLTFSGQAYYKPVQAQSVASNPNYKMTSWIVVNSNLTELLNNGWKIIAQSTHRVATVTTNGVGAIDETIFVYTLSKVNKYITCSVYNPIADKGGSSGCRALN
jgi:hypothetical protein